MARYDRCDPPHQIVKLTRAGHHLWFQLKTLEKGKSRSERYPEQRTAILAALEIIWQLKREIKAALVSEKAEESRKIAARLRKQ